MYGGGPRIFRSEVPAKAPKLPSVLSLFARIWIPLTRRETLGVLCIVIVLEIARGVLGFSRATRWRALTRCTRRHSLVGRPFALSLRPTNTQRRGNEHCCPHSD